MVNVYHDMANIWPRYGQGMGKVWQEIAKTGPIYGHILPRYRQCLAIIYPILEKYMNTTQDNSICIYTSFTMHR